MIPLQSEAVGVVARLLLLVVPFLLVFGLARLLFPRAFERLAEAGNWSANGESVLLAFANGTAATVGALVGAELSGFDGLVTPALVVGGVVTGVAVERRRRPRAPPRTELLALVAALLAVGVATLAGSTAAVRAAGLFLATGAFGGLARAALVAVVSRGPVAVRGDE